MSRVEHLAEGVTLYCGDCREILPTIGKVDAVVTDPPYGLGDWNNRGTNAKRPFDSDITQLWDQSISEEHIAAIFAVSRYQILWGGNYYLGLLYNTKQMLVWNKGIRNMHFNDCEIAWCSQFREACRVFDYSPSSAEPKEHPTQKPLALMEWCIAKLPIDARLICDPFMGSGTTGIAAAVLGRSFIGIEREPKYFDIACRRISDELSRPRLQLEPIAKPTQEAMSL